jgi:ubiquitin-like-conjugating enzyme ATG10
MLHLSWDDFVAQVTTLCSRPRGGVKWEWKWSPLQQCAGFGYAVLGDWEVNQTHKSALPDDAHDEDVDDEAEVLPEPTYQDAACVEAKARFSHLYQLHIVYSTTYQVPVLYFNGKDHAGRILDIDDIWADVPDVVKEHFSNSHISQGEHPVLGIPFYFIHPCNTASLMALLSTTASSDAAQRAYVVNWLSWVSPMFQMPLILDAS